VIQDINDKRFTHLGVLDTDQIKHDEMKIKVRREYLRRVRRVVMSKLNGGNIISAINAWTVSFVPVVRYIRLTLPTGETRR